MTSNATAMVQQAGIVALRDGEPYVRELREHYAARRAQVLDALAAMPGLIAAGAARRVLSPSRGSTGSPTPRRSRWICFARRASRSRRARRSARAGEGHIRLCFAASEGKLSEALERIGEYFARMSS